MISPTKVGIPLCPVGMCSDIRGCTTRHTTCIAERLSENLQATSVAASRGRCLGWEREKVTLLDVAFDSYREGINYNFDCDILRATLEMGIGDKVETSSAMSFKIIQWGKSGVVNRNRGAGWDDLVKAILVEVICGLGIPDRSASVKGNERSTHLDSSEKKVLSVLAHHEWCGGGWSVEDIVLCKDANVVISWVGDNSRDDNVFYWVDIGLQSFHRDFQVTCGEPQSESCETEENNGVEHCR